MGVIRSFGIGIKHGGPTSTVSSGMRMMLTSPKFIFSTIGGTNIGIFGDVGRLIQKNSSVNQLQFVRYATKKAASTKTNDKNSKGKRLGLKKAEGSAVKVGQIIYRQRGTLLYPGENAGIGRDHTIYAKEPGFVRYYMDPFHPERRFVGVSLYQDLRLPTPHWQPRIRRLGLVPLIDKEAIEKEKSRMSRKEYYGWISKRERIEQSKSKSLSS
ncbi:ribosomal L27 protein-domain-containing protein [Dipodascopsis uninucleata]